MRGSQGFPWSFFDKPTFPHQADRCFNNPVITAPIVIDHRIVEDAQPKRAPYISRPQFAYVWREAGIDLPNGCLYRRARSLYLEDAFAIRNEPWEHIYGGVACQLIVQTYYYSTRTHFNAANQRLQRGTSYTHPIYLHKLSSLTHGMTL